MKNFLGSHGGQSFSAGNTYHVSLNGSKSDGTVAAKAETPIRNEGTIDEFRTYANTNTANVTTTVVIRESGADQTVTVNYTASQTGEKSDTSNSFVAENDDELDVDISLPAGSGSIALRSFTVVYDVDEAGGGYCIHGPGHGDGDDLSTASTSYYFNVCPMNQSSTSEEQLRLLDSFTSSNLFTYVSTNGRTTDTTIRTRKNGANGSQSVTYTSGQTGTKEDTSNSDSYSSGDDLGWVVETGTGSGSFIPSHMICTFNNTDGYFFLSSGRPPGANADGTDYYTVTGSAFPSATENTVEDRIGFDAFFSDIAVVAPTNTSSGSTVVSFRSEGTTSSLSVTYTSGQTGVKTDTSTLVSVSIDDIIDFISVESGTGALSITSITMNGISADVEAAGSADGHATAAATGESDFFSEGDADGHATAAATGESVSFSDGSADGHATASGIGSSDVFAVGSSDAIATAKFYAAVTYVHECPRAMFLPELLADQDYTLTLSNSFDTYAMTISKGDWWANLYTFLLHLWELSGGLLSFKPVIIEDGGLFRDNAVAVKFEDGDSYSITWTGGSAGDSFRSKFYSDNGYGENGDLVMYESSAFSGFPVVDSWYTTWPIVEYSREIKVMDGKSSFSQDMLSYSVAGITTECRNLRVQFNRVVGDGYPLNYENMQWLQLHRSYWTKGKSVSFYFDDAHLDISPSSNSWGDTGAGRYESLVLPKDRAEVWRPGRVVEKLNRIDVESAVSKFYIRRARSHFDMDTNRLYEVF